MMGDDKSMRTVLSPFYGIRVVQVAFACEATLCTGVRKQPVAVRCTWQF